MQSYTLRTTGLVEKVWLGHSINKIKQGPAGVWFRKTPTVDVHTCNPDTLEAEAVG